MRSLFKGFCNGLGVIALFGPSEWLMTSVLLFVIAGQLQVSELKDQLKEIKEELMKKL